MGKIKVNSKKCKGCRLCVINCPQGSIIMDKALNIQGVHPARFKGGKCTACTFCALVCPESCIEIYK